MYRFICVCIYKETYRSRDKLHADMHACRHPFHYISHDIKMHSLTLRYIIYQHVRMCVCAGEQRARNPREAMGGRAKKMQSLQSLQRLPSLCPRLHTAVYFRFCPLAALPMFVGPRRNIYRHHHLRRLCRSLKRRLPRRMRSSR